MRSRYSIQKRKRKDVEWDRLLMDDGLVLIYAKTREPVKLGDKISNRAYENVRVIGGSAPSLGRHEGLVRVNTGRWELDFNVDAFALKWVPKISAL